MKTKNALVQLIPIQAEPPSLRDNTGDLDRLKKCIFQNSHITQVYTPYNRVSFVAEAFRNAHFSGVAVLNALPHYFELVDFLPCMPGRLPVVALDLGTTHLEARLLDLLSGSVLAQAATENPQTEHGADILSRIHYATGSANGLAVLQNLVVSGINNLIETLCRQSGTRQKDLRAVAVSGNTTMMHLLLNLNPRNICREPYIPIANAPDPLTASDINIEIHPAGVVWVMPNVGSYFGGDLISGILATGLDHSEKVSMLIDVGTNAEVVIGNNEWLIACAGAAGPALEGGVVEMGMRAGPGAIDHVSLNEKNGTLTYSTIDGKQARGLCGSGLIDLMAQLYLTRIIDIRGKFRHGANDSPLVHNITQKENSEAFLVAAAEETANSQPILITQIDLDALMRSKAAMYSILTTLINQVGLQFADLHKIYVAGAFGKHISPRQAIILGMLPDLPLSTYEPVGNSSLAGAQAVLLDESIRRRSFQIAQKITYIELNVNQEFMIRFSGSKFIPHTDHTLFPTVPFFDDP